MSTQAMDGEHYGDTSAQIKDSVTATIQEVRQLVSIYHTRNPQRFREIDVPMVIVDYGCATGELTIEPFIVMIEEIRKIEENMPIKLYLQDLPQNRFDIAFQKVGKEIEKFKDVFLMASGSDFTRQVFPNSYVDIAYSANSAMILPHAPCLIEDNVWFMATPEVLEQDLGKSWLKSFSSNFKNFLTSRQIELKSGGVSMITVIANQNPLLPYQVQTKKFFGNLYTLFRDKVLSKYSLQHLAPYCNKTATNVFPEHYFEVIKACSELKLVSLNSYDIEFSFIQMLKIDLAPEIQQKIAYGVAQSIRGMWAEVMISGLIGQSIEKTQALQIAAEFFDEVLPKFMGDNLREFPQCMNNLSIILQKE